MAGSTIGGPIYQTVFLGYQGHYSPLTIAKTGIIDPGAHGGVTTYGQALGLYSNLSNGVVLNAGTIHGYNGDLSNGGGYRYGASAVFIEASTSLENQGVIIGGNAGFYGYAGAGVFTHGVVDNAASGLIVGGAANKNLGVGGAGIFSGGTLVDNEGLVVGGSDSENGSSKTNGDSTLGLGGAGIVIENSAGAVFNRGIVLGGNGYTSVRDAIPARVGVGGIGIDAAYVYNKGIAEGGAGSMALAGGIGVIAASLNNIGTVSGGTVTFGTGGAGVVGTVVHNGGIILGGGGTGGNGGDAVLLNEGGVVFNGGTIAGGAATAGANGGAHGYGGIGVDVRGGGGLVIANGLIEGGGTDDAGHGGAGIVLAAGGTVDLFGTVANGNGIAGLAMAFASGASELIVQQNAEIVGGVYAQYDQSNALQLGTATAGTVGRFNLGGTIAGFGTIDFARGSDWGLGGTVTELAAGETINNFASGDMLYLEGFTASSDTYAAGTGLIVSDVAGGSATLDITGSFGPNAFIVTDYVYGTEIMLCYLRGTRLLTPTGEATVESLRIGDELVTRFGATRRIRWIGRQSYAACFIQNNPEKIPVRIAAGALGGGLPKRDLYVSPGHSMLIGDVLVLAKHLVNGSTITQPAPPAQVDYFQVEFATHDCVLAEGAWSESYADGPGLRAQFHNAAEFYALYPEHAPPARLKLCAPRPEPRPEHAAA